MARRAPRDPKRPRPVATVADDVLEPQEESLLDVLDHLLNKGVMLNGDVTLGVAGIDLIYLRLSTLLCAADRVLPRAPAKRRRPRHPSGRLARGAVRETRRVRRRAAPKHAAAPRRAPRAPTIPKR